MAHAIVNELMAAVPAPGGGNHAEKALMEAEHAGRVDVDSDYTGRVAVLELSEKDRHAGELSPRQRAIQGMTGVRAPVAVTAHGADGGCGHGVERVNDDRRKRQYTSMRLSIVSLSLHETQRRDTELVSGTVRHITGEKIKSFMPSGQSVDSTGIENDHAAVPLAARAFSAAIL